MLTATANVLLPTTITGSLPRPSWYTENIGPRAFRDAIADARFRERYTDLVGAHLKDQERAGLDIVTDGDARLDADVGGMSWFQYPARRFNGVSGSDYYKTRKGYGGTGKGDILFEVMESRVMPRCVDKISRGPLHYTATWKLAQGLTTRPVKFGTITPELIGTSIGNDHYANQEDLLYDISGAMREELLDVARAGCTVIQMEEPNIHLIGVQRGGTGATLPVEFFVNIFNNTVRGLRDLTEVWCHTCWGNPAQQRLFATNQSYKDALPHLNQLDVDVLTFECATSDGMDLELIGRHISDKKIAIGVVDHRNLQVERPEQVAALIRKALKHIPAERLVLSSDCGFGREGMSRRIAFFKMVSIVRGTNIVRKELGLPEARCLAADPRYALADELA
ncbi:MAG TPA: cobalamin-independent methionine synthase II family protein [Vicinamibacterales bacterium]|jgi:5-methyltetrahydropteroyltriglutamate--homocysteine methyltransferase|nr:cobalamin-independent methionine synthase II family protein [Vicinamibacterales bacterium]